ncbi:MAG: DUF2321 domain-containing protein [Methanoregula sp.]
MYVGNGYDVAQICKNGHLITACAITEPEYLKNFCPKCGEQTLLKCEFCKYPIQGINLYHESSSLNDYTIPLYCHNCGKPYPWTELQLCAVKKIIDQLNELELSERKEFITALDDIVRDTPNTKPAAYKIREILGKIRGDAQTVIRELIVELITGTAAKIILQR